MPAVVARGNMERRERAVSREAEPIEPVDRHVAGEVRVQSWRRVWVARSTDAIMCHPDPAIGHRIKDPLIWEHGCLRCRHRVEHGPGASRAECGRLVYLIGGGLVNPRGEPIVILAEVAPVDMQEMMRAKMDYERALAFLGIKFPG